MIKGLGPGIYLNWLLNAIQGGRGYRTVYYNGTQSFFYHVILLIGSKLLRTYWMAINLPITYEKLLCKVEPFKFIGNLDP